MAGEEAKASGKITVLGQLQVPYTTLSLQMQPLSGLATRTRGPFE